MSFLKIKGLQNKLVQQFKNQMVNTGSIRQFHLLKTQKLLVERSYQAQILRQNTMQMSFRMHSNKSNEKQNLYEKNFEDLLGNSAANEKERIMMEEQKKMKKIMDEQERIKTEEAKIKFEQSKEQDFEDLLSGKKQKEAEKSLQDLFKEFYTKTKSVDAKAYVNSAKTSLNSFSNILEKRRQKFQQTTKKDEGQNPQQTAGQDKTTDNTSEAKPFEQAAQQETQQNQQEQSTTQDQSTQESPQQPKISWAKSVKTSLEEKTSSINSSISTKFPKTHRKTSKALNYMREVWQETFPNEDNNVKQRIEKRKQIAKMQKELEENQEYIDQLQDQIPEWKKGAVTVTDNTLSAEERGLFGKFKNKLKTKISNTEAMKQFKESEEYKKIEQMRKEMEEFKSNLKEELDQTQNPVVQKTRQMADLVFMESSCARAIKEMQKYDPTFDIQDLHFEAQEIFKEFFCNFLSGNLDYIQKVAGKQALAVVKGDLQVRKQDHWKYKYNDILDCGNVSFLGGMIPDKCPPQFTFTISVQEIKCKVDVKDESIKEGGDNHIVQSIYRIVLSRHEEPDIALTGHYWEIVEFNKVGELQQLV